jgi:hypothetical protein
MRLNIFLLLTMTAFFWSNVLWACHKGGPMGFASNDPGAFSLDITISPTYTGASTSGTAGCKDWDYSMHQRNHYLETQWTFLSEEAAQGKGEHLTALAQIMGCGEERQSQFRVFLRYHYAVLFGKTKPHSNFLRQFEILLSQNTAFSCSG